MGKLREMEIKVGLFVTLGIGLIMLAVLVLGGSQNLLVRQIRYNVHFSNVEGLIPGAKVVIGGVHVGTVETIDLENNDRSIRVRLAIAKKYSGWVRADSTAEVSTQGVLGDKYITLTAGSAEQPVMENNAEIRTTPSKSLTQFLSRGDQLLVSLNGIATSLDRLLKTFETANRSEIFFQGIASTAKNLASATDKLNRSLDDVQLKSAIRNLNGILEKINNGTGTLGALVNDPSLYDDAKTLVGGVNRNRIMRNFVRQTLRDQEADKQKR